MKTIEDSGIVSCHSNNGHTQTILLEENKVLYKIKIHVESYTFQSYARLYVLNTNKEWTLLHSLDPQDFGLTNFYSPFPSNKFKDIINALKKTMKKINSVIN